MLANQILYYFEKVKTAGHVKKSVRILIVKCPKTGINHNSGRIFGKNP